MQVKINGREHVLEESMSVAQLIRQLGWDDRKIAVERNLEIVPKSAHSTTILQSGDRLEIVNFVGGG